MKTAEQKIYSQISKSPYNQATRATEAQLRYLAKLLAERAERWDFTDTTHQGFKKWQAIKLIEMYKSKPVLREATTTTWTGEVFL
jgi:hypothetical protein